MVKMLFLVGSGGFLGSVCRFLVQEWFVKATGSTFPWGTITANVLGSLIIGIVYAIVDKQGLFSQEIRLLVAVGFCGGFTTFSSFALDKFNMIKLGEFFPLMAYVSLSIILSLLMVWVGIAFVKIIS